jgi:uncharacterized RDD family membrane protein YckC
MSQREKSDDTGSGLRPHAYFPEHEPELFEGVLSRRFLAFFIDAAIIVALTLAGWVLLAVLGILTFGLAWLLFGVVFPVVAIVYCGSTLGGPAAATVGMRVMGIEMRTWYGDRPYFVLGAAHAIFFWVSISILTPFILLVGLFNSRRRLLHDFLLGTVILNTSRQAEAMRLRG